MIKEITAKSMLHFHEQTFSTNWDANIYRGCQHNCQYCFAQYSHKYLNTEDFFNEIFVKTNASEILMLELARRKWQKQPVNVCGISDCYQGAEAKYKLMPDVIKAFRINKNPLVIVTKSVLILRDFELIKELNEVSKVSILISVSSLDENIRKLIEPNAAPTIKRLEMLQKFSEIGCKTSVLFMPIIPYLSDSQSNLDEVFRITKELNLGSINAWPLHLRGNTKKVFYAFLSKHFPNLLSEFELLYKGGSVSKEYSSQLRNRINSIRAKYNLYTQYKQPKPIKPKTKELNLFDPIR